MESWAKKLTCACRGCGLELPSWVRMETLQVKPSAALTCCSLTHFKVPEKGCVPRMCFSRLVQAEWGETLTVPIIKYKVVIDPRPDVSQAQACTDPLSSAGDPALSMSRWMFHQQALQEYILMCCQCPTGGLLDKPGKWVPCLWGGRGGGAEHAGLLRPGRGSPSVQLLRAHVVWEQPGLEPPCPPCVHPALPAPSCAPLPVRWRDCCVGNVCFLFYLIKLT